MGCVFSAVLLARLNLSSDNKSGALAGEALIYFISVRQKNVIRRNRKEVCLVSWITFSIKISQVLSAAIKRRFILAPGLLFPSTGVIRRTRRNASLVPGSHFQPKFRPQSKGGLPRLPLHFFHQNFFSHPNEGLPRLPDHRPSNLQQGVVFCRHHFSHKKSHSSRFSSQAGKFILRFLGPSFLCILQVREFQWKNRVESFPRSQF